MKQTGGEVFHISGERGWRGGENQQVLLTHYMNHGWTSHGIVRSESDLQRRLTGTTLTPLRGFGFLRPASAWRLRRLMTRSLKHVVLHAHSSAALETALLARIGSGAPLVVSRRNAFPVKSGWKYRAADAVIAVSAAARIQLLKAGVQDSRIVLIPDAVDVKRFAGARAERLGLPDDAIIVFSASAFAPEKDHETLLRAWRQIEAEANNAHLVLAGEGERFAAIRALSEALSLRRVQFLGWREDAPSLICGCDVVALASRMEGLSSFLCEAQWCGKPVVATNAGGIGEAVADGETGYLSPIADASAMAHNLLRFIRRPALREAFGDTARERAHALFDPHHIAEQHARVYEDVSAG